jgi:hypothetical protein
MVSHLLAMDEGATAATCAAAAGNRTRAGAAGGHGIRVVNRG